MKLLTKRILDFIDGKKINAWQYGRVVEAFEPAVWRKDRFGDFMKFQDYRKRHSIYGWVIDDKGRAIQWQNALKGHADIRQLAPPK